MIFHTGLRVKRGEQELWKYLKTHRLMQIATCSNEPWICTVFYVLGDDKNLYFVSAPDTEHCKAIAVNNIVACAITDTEQTVTHKKKGVQLRGVATMLTYGATIKRALELWNKMNPGVENIINLKNIKKAAFESRVYKIKPTYIKFFNEELYGEEESKIFKFS